MIAMIMVELQVFVEISIHKQLLKVLRTLQS
jgi:hypothetical protein